MLFDLIEKMREKPEKVKNRIAFGVAFSFALIIFLLWLTVIMPDFSASRSRENKAVADEPSPLSTFGAAISSGFSAIGGQFSNLKNAAGALIANSAASIIISTTSLSATTTSVLATSTQGVSTTTIP